MSAVGKVLTGFSLPYVALYAASGTTVTYSSGQKLARGVSVSIEPEASDDNIFYADNQEAENASGTLTGGSVTLTVDGLLSTAETLIMGLPSPTSITVGTNTVDMYCYGDSMSIPYVGIGFVARYMSDGVTSYVPYILNKARFKVISESANTQGEDIEWQTQELSADIMRDDSANHNWKQVGAGQSSEAAAEAVIKTIFSIS